MISEINISTEEKYQLIDITDEIVKIII